VAGSDTLPNIASGLAAGTYYVHVLPLGGLDIDVVSSNGFQLETVAPHVVTAQTSTSGLAVELIFSEPLVGSTVSADWILTADGTTQVIAATSVTDTLVTLTLAAPLSSGQILQLSYSGNGLTDAVANLVETFSGRAVSNMVTGTFNENSVSVPQGSFLTASELLPTDARSLLFFASLTQQAGFDARAALATWNGTFGGFHADYTTGEAAGGIRMRLESGEASVTQAAEQVALGSRYHLLVSAWNDVSGILNARAWILDTAKGAWAEAVNAADVTITSGAIALGPNPLRLFNRSDRIGHPFAGTVNRIALWAAPQSGPIADISDATVRALFAETTGMKDPAQSRLAFGLPLIDFFGTADDYNAGIHRGTLAPFVPTGSFA
jgi:hypothetical protein